MGQLPALLLRVGPHAVVQAPDKLQTVAGGSKLDLVGKVPAV